MTAIAAVVIGVAVGVLSGLAAGAMFEPFATFGFWGAVNGIVVGLLAFLLALHRLGDRSAPAVAAGYGLSILLWCIAIVVGLTAAAWRTPPLSFSGFWLYALALGAAALGLLAFRHASKMRGADTGRA